ncbi:hypothetical protein MMC32_003475 [Xylographa parallela]|nr:hypothetical protein [Xylographa parallela]
MRTYAVVLLALSGLAAVTAHSYSTELHAHGSDEHDSLLERGLDSFEEVPQLLARAIDEHDFQLQTREADAYHNDYAAGLQARDADGAELASTQQPVKRMPRMRTKGRCVGGHKIEWDTRNGPRPALCPTRTRTGTCQAVIVWDIPF